MRNINQVWLTTITCVKISSWRLCRYFKKRQTNFSSTWLAFLYADRRREHPPRGVCSPDVPAGRTPRGRQCRFQACRRTLASHPASHTGYREQFTFKILHSKKFQLWRNWYEKHNVIAYFNVKNCYTVWICVALFWSCIANCTDRG